MENKTILDLNTQLSVEVAKNAASEVQLTDWQDDLMREFYSCLSTKNLVDYGKRHLTYSSISPYHDGSTLTLSTRNSYNEKRRLKTKVTQPALKNNIRIFSSENEFSGLSKRSIAVLGSLINNVLQIPYCGREFTEEIEPGSILSTMLNSPTLPNHERELLGMLLKTPANHYLLGHLPLPKGSIATITQDRFYREELFVNISNGDQHIDTISFRVGCDFIRTKNTYARLDYVDPVHFVKLLTVFWEEKLDNGTLV